MIRPDDAADAIDELRELAGERHHPGDWLYRVIGAIEAALKVQPQEVSG